jgi:hypothetical protein
MANVRLYSPQVGHGFASGPDYTPLQNALNGLVDVFARQEEADRQVKFREITGRYSLDLRRQALQLSSEGDPATRPERFRIAKDQIREKALKELDETGVGGGDLFNIDYEESALSEEFQLRKGASAELAKQTEARLEVTLDGYSRMAGEGSAEQQAQFRDLGGLAISDAMEKGVLDPLEGVKKLQKFRSDIVTAQVRRDIYARPHDAEQALLGDGYKDLSPEARIQWLERASSKAESQERTALANEERAYRMAERYEKDRADQLQKAGDKFLLEGHMTPEWLEGHKEELSAGDYRYFSESLRRDAEKAAEGPKIKTDPHTYADLMGFAMDGQDVRTPAREAFLDQQITREDYDRITSRVEGEQSSGGRKPAWQKQGEEYIRNYFGAQADMDPTAAARKAEALDHYYDWASTHQDADPTAASKARDDIVKSMDLLHLKETLLLLPAPRNLVGTRDRPEIVKTQEALNAEFATKHFGDTQAILNDPDYREQAHLLLQWQKLAPPETEAAP